MKYTDPDGRKTDEIPTTLDALRENRIKAGSAAPPAGACLYGTLLGAAQEFVGKNLTPKQMDELQDELGFGANGCGAVHFDGSWKVENSEAVIAAALKKLTGKDYGVQVIRGNATDEQKKDAQFTVRIVGGHFQLGDKNGNFLWESLQYNDDSHINTGDPNSVRYIIITPPGKKPEE